MYAKIIILKIVPDLEYGGAKTVVLGFFDELGKLQLEIPQVSGKLFPSNIVKGQAVICNHQHEL